MKAVTTEEIRFPVLLIGRFGLLKFRRSQRDLVERVDRLRRLSRVEWFHLVDDDLRRYRITKTAVIRGHGLFFGYAFDGPFLLKRNVLFRADLQLVAQLDLKSGAELIAEFIRDAQESREDDVPRFWAEFGQFAATSVPTLSALWSFYSAFKWGDDRDVDE